MVDIKSQPELQHVLAHMLRAIQFCAEGELEAALYECESIESMVTFDGDDDFVKYVRQSYGLQGQEAEEIIEIGLPADPEEKREPA